MADIQTFSKPDTPDHAHIHALSEGDGLPSEHYHRESGDVPRHEDDRLLPDPEAPAPQVERVPANSRSEGERQIPDDIEGQQEKNVHFFSKPFFSALLFDNQTSEARDLDAAERNFLSWVRLSLVMAVSGTAIMINLRFNDSSSSGLPSTLSPTSAPIATTLDDLQAMLKMKEDTHYSTPLGIVFYVLSIISLLVAIVTYISTCSGYIKQYIVVTNSLSALGLVVVIALTIIASNILLLQQNSHLLSHG